MLREPHDGNTEGVNPIKKRYSGVLCVVQLVASCAMAAFVLRALWGIGLYHGFSLAAPQISSQPSTLTHSGDVSQCPGYRLSSLHQTQTGLTARLSLNGHACNAFGQDINDLTIQVTYETTTRLHVNIFDTANKQYTIPQSVIDRPAPPNKSLTKSSDLVFNYDAQPFAFWITRRSNPGATPLFDTRASKLPKSPISPIVPGDNSTALDGFPLVFEDQYLQIASSLPLGTNIYGLGEVVSSSGFRRNVGPDGGTIQTMWARDIADPVDENLYGSHPVYMEHRFDPATNTSQSHGVFLMRSALLKT
jgi:alpha-glucosidase